MSIQAQAAECFCIVNAYLTDGSDFNFELTGSLSDLTKKLQFVADGAPIIRGVHIASFAISVVIRPEKGEN